MLLAAMFMLALLVLSLSIAIPEITKEIQRDREVETMHRGMQYRRAIQLYYRKFTAYPPSMDALVKSNNIKFLRKKYTDPMTGKDDWKVIGFGQNKAPLAMGFFGEALTGAAGGGGPMAGVGGMTGTGTGGIPGIGSTAAGSTTFGPAAPGASSGTNGALGTQGTGGAPGTTGGTDPNSGAPGSTTGTNGGTGTSGGIGTGAGSGSGFMSGQTGGQSFGGVGMVGVEPGDPKESILLYKKKNHYNEWEFTYSPLSEIKALGSGGAGGSGLPGSGSNTNGNTGLGGTSFGGSNSGASNSGGFNSGGSLFGGSNGSSGSGSSGSSGFGSSGTQH